MGKAVHKRTTYYLPSWQGGDLEIALCQRAPTGWFCYGDDRALADIGVNCPICLGIVAHGRRPCLRKAAA